MPKSTSSKPQTFSEMGCTPSKLSPTRNKYCKRPPHYTRMGCEYHLSEHSPCRSLCANENDCSRCKHIREPRQERVDSVLRRAAGDKLVNDVPGDLSQEGRKNGAEEEAAGNEEGRPGAVRGGDGMQIMDMEMDISDGHAVWAWGSAKRIVLSRFFLILGVWVPPRRLGFSLQWNVGDLGAGD